MQEKEEFGKIFAAKSPSDNIYVYSGMPVKPPFPLLLLIYSSTQPDVRRLCPSETGIPWHTVP